MGIQPLAARLGKTPPQWLLEGLFIVVSVALGFAVAQYGYNITTASLPRECS